MRHSTRRNLIAAIVGLIDKPVTPTAYNSEFKCTYVIQIILLTYLLGNNRLSWVIDMKHIYSGARKALQIITCKRDIPPKRPGVLCLHKCRKIFTNVTNDIK